MEYYSFVRYFEFMSRCMTHLVSVKVADRLREAEQCLLQRDGQAHVKIVAVALEGPVSPLAIVRG